MDEIKVIEQEIKNLQEVIEKAKKDIAELRKKRLGLIVESKDYSLDLKAYAGKEILSVCFVLEDGTIMTRYNDGAMLYADYKGRLVYCSEMGGSIRYEDAFNSYVLSRHSHSELLPILGFFDVETEG